MKKKRLASQQAPHTIGTLTSEKSEDRRDSMMMMKLLKGWPSRIWKKRNPQHPDCVCGAKVHAAIAYSFLSIVVVVVGDKVGVDVGVDMDVDVDVDVGVDVGEGESELKKDPISIGHNDNRVKNRKGKFTYPLFTQPQLVSTDPRNDRNIRLAQSRLQLYGSSSTCKRLKEGTTVWMSKLAQVGS